MIACLFLFTVCLHTCLLLCKYTCLHPSYPFGVCCLLFNEFTSHPLMGISIIVQRSVLKFICSEGDDALISTGALIPSYCKVLEKNVRCLNIFPQFYTYCLIFTSIQFCDKLYHLKFVRD